MRIFLPLLLVLGLSSASAQDSWFTVMGSRFEPTIDTMELDLTRVHRRGDIFLMDLRVNLAAQRSMTGGEKYTSYVSRILIECDKKSVVHIEQTRYENALWQGTATFQRFPEIRPMAFGGLSPNPKARVLKAACAGTPEPR